VAGKMFKKLTSLVLAFLLIASIIPSAVYASFKDIPRDHWAHDEIRFLESKGLYKGIVSGDFKPMSVLTRKEAAIMLVRAMKLQTPAKPKLIPGDMKSTMNGYKEVLAVMEKGMFTLSGKNFSPNASLTRKEMAKVLAVAYGYTGTGKSSFKDLPKSNPYYKFIDAIVENEVTSGYKDGTFKPDVAVNRAQFSTFLARIYSEPHEYIVRENGKTLHKVKDADEAIKLALNYQKATVHPVSNSLMTYEDKTGLMKPTGIKNGVLIYNGNENNMSFTTEYFKPYLTINTTAGAPRPLFDTFIILGRSYKGGEFVQVAGNHANYKEWLWYADKSFASDGPLLNLNTAAKSAGKKVNVYLSIPYPKHKEAIIGLDGKKRANNLDERVKLVAWYMNTMQTKWNKAGFTNLNFKGYYWLNETVIDLQDELLVEKVAKSIHAGKKSFIYSPHALTTNFENWKTYGFDGAYLQPNTFRLKFSDTETATRLHKAFLEAQINGSGINIEIDTYSPHQMVAGLKNFEKYAEMAERYNLPGRSLIFYQGNEMLYRMGTQNHAGYPEAYNLVGRLFE
jgi:hypothetical protein